MTKQHAIQCLQMHERLIMPISILDPLSNLLNQLPTRPPRSAVTRQSWAVRWPVICHILYELDHLFHGLNPPPSDPSLGYALLQWLTQPSHTTTTD
ncbi:hypothetical protein BDF20DRAFT_983103 [Mycotypha africana]|uniref:uncharacterized protein n=1 Tax=Mycotypha africana TaxID=64632 RepID=UPI002300EBE2|nr:uncharacterized protein BDF20DRAFT_983103 [Mycotypha africana]KAI8967127.1 hypothetical protein BDF20DRAFT_983103 [Mycotypha africana]